MIAEQVHNHEFLASPVWLADLKFRLPVIARGKNMTIESWDDSSFGETQKLCIKLGFGPVVSLIERDHAITSERVLGPSIEASRSDVETFGKARILGAVLRALGLDQTAIASIPGRKMPALNERSAQRMVRQILARPAP